MILIIIISLLKAATVAEVSAEGDQLILVIRALDIILQICMKYFLFSFLFFALSCQTMTPKKAVKLTLAIQNPTRMPARDDHNAQVCSYDSQTKKFKKADGTTIQLNFGMHLEREFKSELLVALLSIVMNSDGSPTNLDKAATSKAVCSAVEEKLKDTDEVLSSINQQMKEIKNQKPKWLAIEAAPYEMEIYRQALALEDLAYMMMGTYNCSPDLRDRYNRLSLGPVWYLQKQKFSLPSIQPSEDDVAKKRGTWVLDGRQAMEKILYGATVASSDKRELLSEGYDKLMKLASQAVDLGKPISDSTELRNIFSDFGEENKEYLEMYLKTHEAWMISLDERNYYAAFNISKYEGSGMFIMGEAHEQGVQKYLTEICKGTAVQPAAAILPQFVQGIIGRSSP